MAKKGLTKEIIVNTALGQIEEKGLTAFSLRNLAASLGVQVSSLYNHIHGQNDLLAEVGICAVNMLTGLEEAAIADKLRDEALFSLADTYRQFAGEHTELYRI
ncbi:MAG: TetR/AcrR family transcriptional regulator, partial [Lachnospiraceae bacterium]|nr:TetR/AcrR family transcriptional regulator [Lachnospiraceae bacterium]